MRVVSCLFTEHNLWLVLLMNRPALNPDEARLLNVIADVMWDWSQKPRSPERAGAMVAMGSILGRLGWQTLGLDETDRRARDKKRGPTL